MSKSLKNFITIRSLLLDHDPDDFRVFCLQHRYSANVDYRYCCLPPLLHLSGSGLKHGVCSAAVRRRWRRRGR